METSQTPESTTDFVVRRSPVADHYKVNELVLNHNQFDNYAHAVIDKYPTSRELVEFVISQVDDGMSPGRGARRVQIIEALD